VTASCGRRCFGRRNATTPKLLLQRFGELGFRVQAQTELLENLPGRHGERFDLQDIWFARS